MKKEILNTVNRVKKAIKKKVDFEGIEVASSYIYSDYEGDFLDPDAIIELNLADDDEYDAEYDRLIEMFEKIAENEFKRIMTELLEASKLVKKANSIVKEALK